MMITTMKMMTMKKIFLNAKEIQQILQDRISMIDEIIEDDVTIKVPKPTWHEDETDGELLPIS